MSTRTPPTRITEAELRALRRCVAVAGHWYGAKFGRDGDPRKTMERARAALDKLSGLPRCGPREPQR